MAMAVAAMRDGAVDFLEKPFDNQALVARVRQVLEDDSAAAGQRALEADYRGRHATLSPRERQVLDLMLIGRTSREIADALGGSHRTIEIHRGRVMAKMRAPTPADLVRMMLLLRPERAASDARQ